MSLVLDALRRVQKSDQRTGAVGVAVASSRPARRVRRSWIPLVLGLAAGGFGLLLFGRTPDRLKTEPASLIPSSAPRAARRTALGGAGLPPPLIIEPVAASGVGRGAAEVANPSPVKQGVSVDRAAVKREEIKVPTSFMLHAISERDSRPIAVINDQVVKEGDLVGRALVVKIFADSVELLLESGLKEVVRFAPPPPGPTPSPEGR